MGAKRGGPCFGYCRARGGDALHRFERLDCSGRNKSDGSRGEEKELSSLDHPSHLQSDSVAAEKGRECGESRSGLDREIRPEVRYFFLTFGPSSAAMDAGAISTTLACETECFSPRTSL